MTYKVTLPPAFALDRYERDLPIGQGTWVRKGYRTELTDAEAREMLNDAQHYASPDGPDVITIGLRNSAKATVRVLRATGVGG